jgi:hypothetical protein
LASLKTPKTPGPLAEVSPRIRMYEITNKNSCPGYSPVLAIVTNLSSELSLNTFKTN